MENIIQVIRNLGPARVGAIIGIAMTLLGFFVFLATRLSSPDMKLLYGDLDAQASNEIIAQLSAQQIPFEIRGDGSQVLVPSNRVGELRLQLAGLGVSGSVVGYEIFDRDTALGTSSFVQEVNRLRALEGELSRTIGSLSTVKAARVHLVLPRRELFSRDAQDPTASVVLKMRGANRLDKPQVLAIQQLVATAVPKLKPERISILDDRGSLLSRGADDASGGAATTQELRSNIENRMRRNIEELLERTVGFGKVRAEVNAEIELGEVVINEDLFDPEGQVLRSNEALEETSSLENAGDEAVSVQNNLPEGLNAGGAGGGQREATNRTEERNNFEISRTRRNTVIAAGAVKKISVAVLVDGTYSPNEEGDMVYNPRSQEEMEQLEKLVKSAIGYDEQARGDVVEIINMQFAEPPDLADGAGDTYFGLTPSDIKWLLQTLILGALAVLVILLVVRPLLTKLLEARSEAISSLTGEDGHPLLTDQSGATMEGAGSTALATAGGDGFAMAEGEEAEGGSMIDIANIEGRVKASSMKKIGEIIDKHPEEAVSILRTWMYQEST